MSTRFKPLLKVGFILVVLYVVIRLSPLTYSDVRRFPHKIGIHANGQVINHSQKPLWVIITKDNRSWAYILAPHRKSPDNLDADAVKSLDQTLIQADTAWHKLLDGSKAEVQQTKTGLQLNCLLCYSVDNQEFINIIYDKSPDWGSPLD